MWVNLNPNMTYLTSPGSFAWVILNPILLCVIKLVWMDHFEQPICMCDKARLRESFWSIVCMGKQVGLCGSI